MTRPSINLHPNTRDAYLHRIRDLKHAYSQMVKRRQKSNEIVFLSYYFTCEALAKIMIGVWNSKSVAEQFRNRKHPHINGIKNVCHKLQFSIKEDDLNWIFWDDCNAKPWKSFLRNCDGSLPSVETPKSARWLRNKFAHDLGRWHVRLVRQHSSFLNTKMSLYIDCIDDVADLLSARRSLTIPTKQQHK